jgi:hypothetical protein
MKLLAEWWAQIWPNLAASGLCVGGAYFKLRTEAAARHLEVLAVHRATRQIVADLYRHRTGKDHPAAGERP